MSHPRRIEYEGAWHHVMNRDQSGAGGTFPDDDAYAA